jgi:hypothetical protein
MMKNNNNNNRPITLVRILQIMAIGWLIESPLLIQPFEMTKGMKKRTDLNSSAPLITRLNPHQQLVLAIILNIDTTLDLLSLGFCQPIIDILRGCPRSEWNNIAVSLQLTAVVDLAVKFSRIHTIHSLTNFFASIDVSVANACITIFAALTAAHPIFASLLDIRGNPHLPTLLSRYGCLDLAALINLCLIIQLSLFLNPDFINVCVALFPDLALVLNNQVVGVFTNCLLALAVQVNVILTAVLILLVTVLTILTSGFVFPCLYDVLLIVSPHCPCLSAGRNLFLAVFPRCAFCPVYSVPCPPLLPAKCVYDLVSLC